MVSNLFTAFALIATGRVEVPPAPTQPLPMPEVRGLVRETERDETDADRGVKRR